MIAAPWHSPTPYPRSLFRWTASMQPPTLWRHITCLQILWFDFFHPSAIKIVIHLGLLTPSIFSGKGNVFLAFGGVFSLLAPDRKVLLNLCLRLICVRGTRNLIAALAAITLRHAGRRICADTCGHEHD